MVEKQLIKDKDVWLKVNPWHIERGNPNIIPTEYFTVSWFLEEPAAPNAGGKMLLDENGSAKLFESPVEAISYAGKKLQDLL